MTAGVEITALDALSLLLRMNVAAGLAVVAVLLVRPLVRRLFGADVAYVLWLAPCIAALGALLPVVDAFTPLAARRLAGAMESETAGVVGSGAGRLLLLWALGAALTAALMGLSQLLFLHRAARGRAGPALVGVFAPRLVVPADFADRFSAAERSMVRAHERAHIDRQDPLANAFIALLQVINWFNPLVHLAAVQARHDQELACDARVIAQRPGVRRLYAETLLKTQLGATPLPLGCHWAARARHPLELRVALLKQDEPGHYRRLAGMTAVLAVGFAVGYGAWAAQPPSPAPLNPPIFIQLKPPAGPF
jgi:beta-lactamase regulating signal transducer with metallopeptidase domain